MLQIFFSLNILKTFLHSLLAFRSYCWKICHRFHNLYVKPAFSYNKMRESFASCRSWYFTMVCFGMDLFWVTVLWTLCVLLIRKHISNFEMLSWNVYLIVPFLLFLPFYLFFFLISPTLSPKLYIEVLRNPCLIFLISKSFLKIHWR